MKTKEFIPPYPLKTAVLFLIFNRLDTTKQVFEEIRKAKPPRLYIAADGPRENKEGEKEKVGAVRKYVLENIDWNCEVKTLFRDKNLGCGKAVSQAITWFFENEEMGIILEDDCLPSQSFFWFCEKLLKKYNKEKRIMLITGTSYLFNEIERKEDYFFSRYVSIWGWASWRRAWKYYDINMKNWPEIKKNNKIKEIFYWDKKIAHFFSNCFEIAFNKKIDTWDYQWVYTCFTHDGYCLTPYKNLISNIGFKGTRESKNSPFINMERLDFHNINNLKCPKVISYNLETDKILFYNIFYRFQRYKNINYILRNLNLLEIAKKIKKIYD